MSDYQSLKKFLEKSGHAYNIRKLYFVIAVPKSGHHITVYENYWDDYETVTGHPYYMFHISSNNENDRCSSYYWVDKRDLFIIDIPESAFKYEQPEYDFTRSTRKPCSDIATERARDLFQKFLLDNRQYQSEQH